MMKWGFDLMRRVLLAIGACLALAAPSNADGVRYFHLDGLGNVRVVTNQAGDVVERHDYFPFGEECVTGPCSGNTPIGSGQPRHFTGKERDKETGLDYFGARYYASKIGRFTTVDPLYTWNENLLDPQRWNRYSYVRNNPFRYVDPDGRGIASKAVKVIVKGGDVASTFKGVVDDAAVLLSPDVTLGTGARLLAAGSLASELLPVSGSDVKEGAEFLGSVLRRPYIRKWVRTHVDDVAPRTADGLPIDPNTLEPIGVKPDLGHKYGREFRREKARAEAEGLPQKDFNERMNDPDHYQLEHPSSNRSRRYEKPGNDQ
jgi:RHS repeat-associated protein